MNKSLQQTKMLIDAMNKFNQEQMKQNDMVRPENSFRDNSSDLENVLKVIGSCPKDTTSILSILMDTFFMPQAKTKQELYLIYRVVVSKIVETLVDNQHIRILTNFANEILNKTKKIMIA